MKRSDKPLLLVGHRWGLNFILFVQHWSFTALHKATGAYFCFHPSLRNLLGCFFFKVMGIKKSHLSSLSFCSSVLCNRTLKRPGSKIYLTSNVKNTEQIPPCHYSAKMETYRESAHMFHSKDFKWTLFNVHQFVVILFRWCELLDKKKSYSVNILKLNPSKKVEYSKAVLILNYC